MLSKLPNVGNRYKCALQADGFGNERLYVLHPCLGWPVAKRELLIGVHAVHQLALDPVAAQDTECNQAILTLDDYQGELICVMVAVIDGLNSYQSVSIPAGNSMSSSSRVTG